MQTDEQDKFVQEWIPFNCDIVHVDMTNQCEDIIAKKAATQTKQVHRFQL
jgi:hypothetical protein